MRGGRRASHVPGRRRERGYRARGKDGIMAARFHNVPRLERVKPLVLVLLLGVAVAATALLAEAAVFGGAFFYHHHGLYDDEIRWLKGFRSVMGWEKGVDKLVVRRERERIERVLLADRIDRAVALFRSARADARRAGRPLDSVTMGVGIEAYRRAADRMAKHGRLSEAADWNDSLFVLAVRAPSEQHRYAAVAAFMEGLDLRVRDGQPCAALARVQWAKRGLGGVIPGMANDVEAGLTRQCSQQRRAVQAAR